MITIKSGQELKCIKEIPGVTGAKGISMDSKFIIGEVFDNCVHIKTLFGIGVFSRDELEVYFEDAKTTPVVIKKQYADSVFGDEVTLYVNKDKRTVVAKLGYILTKAKCLEEDVFDEKIGIGIALAKLNLKLLENKKKIIYKNIIRLSSL